MKAGNLTGLIIVLICGCQGSISINSSPTPLTSQFNNKEIPMTNPMKPTNPVSFIPGPPIKPSNQLLKWLNKEAQTKSGARKRLRLPVVIHFQDSYRLALGDSFIGTSETNRDNDAIFLSLDDTAMSVSLLSTLRDVCPKMANSCIVWLEGYWGTLIDLNLPELSRLKQAQRKDIKSSFSVLKVHEFIKAQAGQDEETRVLIESLSS